MRCRLAVVTVGLMLAGCSRAPEAERNKVVAVRGAPAAARVAGPSVRPTPVPTAARSSRPVERRAFVDPPLPPELVDPPGLAPLPKTASGRREGGGP